MEGSPWRAPVHGQTARMRRAGMRGVGMRRCTLTPCSVPAHGSGETGIARGSIPRAGVRAGERFALKSQ
jgi:hypothetical protein